MILSDWCDTGWQLFNCFASTAGFSSVDDQPVSVQQRLSSSHYDSCQRLWTQLLSLIMITDIGHRHNVAALVFFLFWSILLAGLSSRVRGWLPGSKFLFPHCICLLCNLKWPRLCWQCQNHLRQGVYIHRKEQYQLNRWTGATDWGLPWMEACFHYCTMWHCL